MSTRHSRYKIQYVSHGIICCFAILLRGGEHHRFCLYILCLNQFLPAVFNEIPDGPEGGFQMKLQSENRFSHLKCLVRAGF